MDSISDVRTLAQAMVDTIRDPLLLLDDQLCVVAASRSFYSTFHTTSAETIGRMVYDLVNGTTRPCASFWIASCRNMA